MDGPPPALTPELALAYLRELSTDIRSAVVLDAGGRPVAGDEALVEPARALLASTGRSLADRPLGEGALVAGRGATHAVALVVGRHALLTLVRHDLGSVLDLLAGPAAEAGAQDAGGPP